MLLAFLLQAVDKASKSPGTAESINHGWNVSLDIAAVLNALLWPLAVLVILLAYRDKIPGLAQSVASRITKVGFAGVSLELAKAAAFVPEWSGSPGTLDLRQKATAIQVNDSTAMTFSAQLMEGGTADYAEVNLGAGQEWLTSRLFIMSIVFARMKWNPVSGFCRDGGNREEAVRRLGPTGKDSFGLWRVVMRGLGADSQGLFESHDHRSTALCDDPGQARHSILGARRRSEPGNSDRSSVLSDPLPSSTGATGHQQLDPGRFRHKHLRACFLDHQ